MSREKTGFVLIEKNPKNLDLVSKILKTRLPKSALSYNVTKLVADGVLKEPTHIVNIYAFKAELEDISKTFLCVQLNFEYPKTVLTSSPEDPTDEMVEAFSDVINVWTEMVWYVMEKTLWPKVECRLGPRKPCLIDETTFVAFSPNDEREDAISLKESPINTEFKVKPLSLKDAGIVDQNWFPDGPSEKIIFIEDAINYFTTAGIYVKGEESPAAFGIASLIGSINCVHTMDDHRRKGFAVAVVQDLVKRCKELGMVPCAHIVKGNSQSQGLFNKSGFSCASENIIICFDDRIVRPSTANSEAAENTIESIELNVM
ncbi:unnamed protein product [Allacma fusca]|uniref:GCN5-related N-acetyltransferase Rv2170-like domain-containing protein n=1 Tax=Allacma fusca TaxID=39272 RepID=A0A8J2JK87_9HEXA|nr:unnamed protein product [Allacma fusca]